MLFTFVYSVPWLGRTKARGMLANLTIAIPRGCLLKVAGWAMVAHVFHTEPWFIGAIFGIFLIGASSTKDFADIPGDRAGGCRTLPILYGPRKAAWIIARSSCCRGCSCRSAPSCPIRRTRRTRSSPATRWLLTALGAILTAWGSYTVYLLLRDPDELTRTENHPSWRHMYLMMMAAQVGFALAYVL